MRMKLFLYLSFMPNFLRGYYYLLLYKILGVTIRSGGRLAIAAHTLFQVYGKKARVYFGHKVYIRRNCSLVLGDGATLRIGDRFFMNSYSSLNCLSNVEIGDDCLIGEGVRLYDHNYDYRNPRQVPTNQKGHRKGKISIGNNCWLGSNSIILMDVTIGNNVIIGANNLIVKDVPDNTIIMARQELIERPFFPEASTTD